MAGCIFYFAFGADPSIKDDAAFLELSENRILRSFDRCGKTEPVIATIVNRGKSVARILEVQKSCGCLGLDIKCPVELRPGKSLDVRVDVRVPRETDKIQHYGIFFVYDANNGRAFSLPLALEIVATNCPESEAGDSPLIPVPDERF